MKPLRKTKKKYIYRYICELILVVLATAMFAFTWIRFVRVNNQTGHLTGTGNIGMAILLYAGLFLLIGYWLGAFHIGVDRKSAVMASVALTAAVVDAVEVFLSMAITGQFRFFGEFVWRYILLCLIQVLVLSVLTIPMTDLYRKRFPPLQILEIYGDRGYGLDDKVNSINYKYHVREILHYGVGEEEIRKQIGKYDAVLISDIPAHEKNQILKMCVDMDKRVYYVPKLSDIITASAEKLNLIDTPLFLLRNSGVSRFELNVKSIRAVLLSFLALVVLSPVFLVTAILIKLEDGGPVFYRQERVTVGGKRFMILKFRSMIVDAEKDGKPHPAGEQDPRVTKVGRAIRAWRIDELPQLINILIGDMSVVGPRPERVEHVKIYTDDIPEFQFRSKMKGGLTGYAQVYGKYNTTALDKLKLDLIYIMNYSLLLDLQILFETVKILFRKESTEGFSKERAERMHEDGGK